MVTITKGAAKEVQRIMEEQDTDANTHFLRVGVRGGGCSGMNYSLDVVDTKSDMDEEWEHEGIKVICDSKSHLYLDGTEVDFKDEVMGRGFVFKNPNATTSCGCGSSFST